MKGAIQPNHVSKNNFELQVIGLPPITFVEVGDISEQIDKVDLPDRTRASGGTKQAGDFPVTLPSHHDVEVAAMEAWYKEAQDPVAPTYKKSGVLIKKGIDGSVIRTYTFTGLWVSERNMTAVALENEGEMDAIEYLLNFDDIIPTT